MTQSRERLRALLQKSALDTQASPLSFSQQRLWFAEQLDPGTPVYNIAFVIGMQGALDVPALERSLQDIVDRHEVLRTTFQSVDGQPVLAIAPPAPRALPVVEVAGAAAWAQLKKAEATRPFDLENGPLLRTLLVRHAAEVPATQEAQHSLLLSLHHIVADGWSVGVLVRELATLYDAHVRGAPVALPALPLRYTDHARRQAAWMASEEATRQLAYWKDALAGAPAMLALPTDRPRGPMRSGRGAELAVALPGPLTAQLGALARREGATLFMTLLAAYQILLARLAGQTDVVVGTVIANRSRSDLEGLIGIFVNPLALRGNLASNPRFTDFLASGKATALAAYAHQELPFDKLIEALSVERDLARTPVFQAMLVLQNAPLAPLALPGLVISPEEAPRDTAQTDVSLTLREVEGRLVGSLEYDTDLFDRETVARWMRQLETMLGSIVADPAQRVLELAWLTAAERHHLLHTFSGQAIEVVEPLECLPRVFEAQVQRTPDAVAVTGADGALSYDALNRRANRLAWRLRSLGVGPEVAVGIGLPASVDEVVARLAVLKAGGAFVPIDPVLPQQRRRQLVAQSGARVLITHAGDPAGLEGEGACARLHLDDLGHGSEGEANLPDTPALDSLAYIIFTSGSTGVPKGVMIPHRGIAHRMLWEQRQLPLGAEDRVLQLASASVDASIWEMFRALLSGARLVLVPAAAHGDSRYLVQRMAEEAITVISVVPSLLEALLEEPRFRACTRLSHVVCAGEPLRRAVQDRFAALHGATLYNFYGQTEVSIDATCWTGPPEGAIAPLGRPIAGMQVYVLDDARAPVPIGVPGEVYISGPGLARGYLGAEELTRERFLPHPVLGASAAVFRTGDRARFRADGVLEFVGREGEQVKIRGNRVELGEVEAVLKQHPGVRQVALLALPPDDDDGLVRLVEAIEHSTERSVEPSTHSEATHHGN